MVYWQNTIVFIRDFAYPPRNRRLRMANNIGDSPAAVFADLLSGPTIVVTVGESRRHWSLHRNLLCHHSEYLANELLPNETKKQPKNELNLPDDDPAGFELLVKWLYQGKIEDVSDMPDPYRKYEYAVSCHKLYLLCHRFEMAELKNIAMDQYRKGLAEARLVPDAEEVNEIYRRSSPGSPFRRLVTKIAARQIMDPDNEKDAGQYRACFRDNPDFGVDLVNAIRFGSGGALFDDPTQGDNCLYHDHESGPNCRTKGKARQGFASSQANGSASTDGGGGRRKVSPGSGYRAYTDTTYTAVADTTAGKYENDYDDNDSSSQRRPASPLSPPNSSPPRTPSPPTPTHVGNRYSPSFPPSVDRIVNGVEHLGHSPSWAEPPRAKSVGGSPQRGRGVGAGESASSTPRRAPPKLERRARGASKGSAAGRSETG